MVQWLNITLLLVAVVSVTGQMSAPKHDYNILIKSVKMNARSDGFLSKESEIKGGFYNDTMPVLLANINLVKPSPPAMMIHVKGWQQNTNGDWVPNFDQNKKNYCEYVDDPGSAVFLKNVLDASNLQGCPLAKGEYYIKNMVIDETAFPVGLQERKWKVDVILTDEEEVLVDLSIFADIEKKDVEDDKK